MQKKEGKTLYVFVYDSVKVSDKYKEKRTQAVKAVKPVFNVSVNQVLKTLFAGISSYARPPTSNLIFLIFNKKPLGYLV